MIPLLRTRSEKRRAENDEFAAYLDRIERSNERIKSGEISLNLEERIQLAGAEEEEVNDMQQPIPQIEEDEDDAKDLVLHEALQVLIDMIQTEKGQLAQSN